MFGKKKPKNILSVIHYEGLPNFNQDSPCALTHNEDTLVFETNTGNIVNLKIDKLTQIERMPELNFMGKYHNNAVNTAKSGVKWFTIIHYTASDDSQKYIAVWNVDFKSAKFFEDISAKLQSKEVTL